MGREILPQHLMSIIDDMPNMIGYWDRDLRCCYANNIYSQWFDKQPSDIIGITFRELTGEHLFSLNEPHILKALAGEPQRFERTLTKVNGSVGHIVGHYLPDFDDDGTVRGFSILASEITDLKCHEKQLELVIKSTGIGIWDWQVQTGKTVFNERWANIIGYTLEELSPVTIDTWIKYAHPDDLKESDHLLKEHWAGKTEYYLFESRMKHKNGSWVWVYDTGQVVEWESDGVPKRMIGTHMDITEKVESQIKLNEANKKLEELSYLDSLTEIPNRRAYQERLALEISVAKRTKTSISLLVIDLDYFKEYNDNYGHESGDFALFTVAKLIEKTLPRATDFVARYGGEEIVVILPHTSIEGATFTAKKILQSVTDKNIEHSDSKFKKILTVSIGVASAEAKFDEIFSHADNALYLAKENGRNRYEIHTEK
jgi:diguanylate cyclase (GGDEF)-like protein/PAS domain S-box-containing protein